MLLQGCSRVHPAGGCSHRGSLGKNYKIVRRGAEWDIVRKKNITSGKCFRHLAENFVTQEAEVSI